VIQEVNLLLHTVKEGTRGWQTYAVSFRDDGGFMAMLKSITEKKLLEKLRLLLPKDVQRDSTIDVVRWESIEGNADHRTNPKSGIF
jgi:hypothetical protein